MVIFLSIIHVIICLFLVLVVLLQQGKGGGLGASFGGGGAGQVFGGGGAGNLLTRTTAICATLFMLTSVSLAYISTSGDRALRDRAKVEEQQEKKDTETKPRDKGDAPKDAPKNEAPGTVPSAQTP
jgi:preprotein translocase subunit SecG